MMWSIGSGASAAILKPRTKCRKTDARDDEGVALLQSDLSAGNESEAVKRAAPIAPPEAINLMRRDAT